MKVSVAVRQKFHGYNLAQELENRGLLTTLFTAFYGKAFGKNNSIGFSIPEIKVKTNLLSAVNTYGLANRYAYWADCQFGNWVAKNMGDEDAIVTWGIQALPIIKRAKELGIKVILERGSSHVNLQRELLFEEFEKECINTKDLKKSFSQKRMERENLEYELADIISIPSLFVRKSFLDNGVQEKKLFVNNYGVSLNHFKQAPIDHTTFRIVFAGNHTLQKGIHYLLKAFSLVMQENIELWLIGKKFPEIELYLKKYNNLKIKCIEPVSQNRLSELFNQCDVFCIPSIQEGLAMVIAQAMACGLPIIATTNSGASDIVEEGKEGFIVPIRDVESISNRIMTLYNDRDLRKEMSINAQTKVSQGLTWEHYGDRYVKKLSELISGPNQE